MRLRPSLAPLAAALLLVTCAGPDQTGPSGGLTLHFTPPSLSSFSGLVVERIHALVYRNDPTQEGGVLILDRTVPFAVDRNSLTLALTVQVEAAAETLDVQLEFQTGQGRTLFVSSQQVQVTRGGSVNTGTLPPPTYIGPGANAAGLTVSPQNPVVAAGGTLDFTVSAVDIQGAPVDTVYTHWRASGGAINALGHLTAPGTAGSIYVVAVTPNGVTDSTPVTILAAGAAAIAGRVVDGSTQAGLAGATVQVLDGTGAQVASVQTGADGSYSTPALAPGVYNLVISLNGFVGTTLFDATVSSGATTVPTVPLAPSSASLGGLTGVVRNATTAAGVPGATVELRPGVNASTSQPASITADTAGQFSFARLPAGTYTLTASDTGFIPSNRTSVVIGGQTLGNQDLVLSPVGASNVRIVLTWDSLPTDLDAHLTGPDTAATLPRFHVYYADQGSLTARPYAALDVDDTESFGPETITISKQFPGVYRFSVHDFSDAGLTGSTALASSGAKVVVYINGAAARQFFVPNQPGTLWTVFELNGSTITPVNVMSDQSNSDSIAIRAPSLVGSDRDLILRSVGARPKR